MSVQKNDMSARTGRKAPSQRRRLAGFSGRLLSAGAAATFILGGCATAPARPQCPRTCSDVPVVNVERIDDSSKLDEQSQSLLAESPELSALYKTYPQHFSKLAALGEARFGTILGRLTDSTFWNLFDAQPDLFVSIATGFKTIAPDSSSLWSGERFLSMIAESPEFSELYKTYPQHFSKLAALGESRFGSMLGNLTDPKFRDLFDAQPDLFVSIATGFRSALQHPSYSSRGEQFLSMIAESDALTDLFKTHPTQFSEIAALGEERFEEILFRLLNEPKFYESFRKAKNNPWLP